MRKFIEKTIAGEDAAFWVNIGFDDASFGHEFGTEKLTEVIFDIEECEGCTPAQAEQWCRDHQWDLVKWAEKQAEDERCDVPNGF